jgi:transposase-like protein
MQYDGSGKLSEAIADLCGLSPKSGMQITERIKEAKDGLGITSKSKRLPDEVKLDIYRWHYERLNSVQDVKQDDGVQDNPVQSLPDTFVQDVKQNDDKLELLPDNTVYNVKHDDGGVYNVKRGDNDVPVDDFKQIHFAVTVAGKRTTVMIEGYLVKALQRKHGLPDNMAIRAWIEQAIKNDGVRFDNDAPLTKQVKRLIVESFV